VADVVGNPTMHFSLFWYRTMRQSLYGLNVVVYVNDTHKKITDAASAIMIADTMATVVQYTTLDNP
jgi:hypothetical protein